MATEKTIAMATTTGHHEPETDASKEAALVHATPTSDDARSVRSARSDGGRSVHVPMHMKVTAVVLVSLIGFGSHWSSGVTGAMKSTLKKELDINNAQYAVLEASTDFMTTALILFTGILTDRIGGAGAIFYGNIIYTLGSIIIASATTVRSYHVMMDGMIVQALGDIATQVAQYRIFSSWFAPSNGFAFTLGFELGIGKIGSFVGQATANPISKGTGDFMWVYWTAVFMNVFTNIASAIFYFFRKYTDKHYSDGIEDPATGEQLRENTKRFEIQKILQMPWPFWGYILFTAFQTSLAVVFSQNATELAEQRFNVSGTKAGWYTASAQYLGFFLVPLLGAFLDLFGHRLTVLFVCGTGCFLAMLLAAFGPSKSGTAAAFGIYAVAYTLGPTTIIDGIRTSIWYQDTFGAAYAVKIAVNNSMNIIIRIITGVIQDDDGNSYDHVVIVYVIQAAGAVLVSGVLLGWSFFTDDLRRLQWSKKKRTRNGAVINAQREEYETGSKAVMNRKVSMTFFTALVVLILGAWSAYFWGVATGNND
ncbi:Major facilitator superfamily domain-containing protein 1 [Pseudocercospora fuligena]|uniref:Lysosomal dipeptide transporter MFSD1 n=1 Tax=Pseudocercospora fuligena TaxID=685502 RepID=A0A8H6RJ66_9PEZI|nr:Major facilitator superfamily domain-containing protein 1 [Pseudocercospora fuligena]